MILTANQEGCPAFLLFATEKPCGSYRIGGRSIIEECKCVGVKNIAHRILTEMKAQGRQLCFDSFFVRIGVLAVTPIHFKIVSALKCVQPTVAKFQIH